MECCNKNLQCNGVHTIASDDGWFLPGSANDVTLLISGTLNVQGTLSLDGGLLFVTGVVNANGGDSHGKGSITFEASGINDCGGVVNLIGGSGSFTGSMQLEDPNANFENRGVFTAMNTNVPSDIGVIKVLGGSTLENSGTIPAGIVVGDGTFIDNQPSPCPNAVGGEFVGIDSVSVLAAGAQYTVTWMIPVIVSAIGIGIALTRKIERKIE